MRKIVTDEFLRRADYVSAAQFIAQRTRYKPTIGLILGSGLNALADQVRHADRIPYRDIPGFPVSTVEGHAGELVIGELSGKAVIVMRGRAHYYEGYSMQRITLPVRVMRELGVHSLIVTNAAGGVNADYRPGDLMLIVDHINLVGMAGLNPLRGPNDNSLGPRFPDMSQAYDPMLRDLACQVAREQNIVLQQGVYMMLAGPSFESPADVRFVRMIGADAVGMSTVPEVIVARHGGMRVLGLSMISNSLSGHFQVSHDEVLAAGQAAAPRLAALIQGILARL
ncbi:MAG: purine-nucleoside phosphorylase [candidate division KSB1 bacterium]|nr:purine-nucleoside phosphorylase [candidate division KSB1 bacterium]